ncbi:hypothetical protein [Moorella sp. ACPs]|uniref:hypothetical protein n=1 Tax=Neomoorella carbonis TaxID=3062783 RepID=UPI003873AD4B
MGNQARGVVDKGDKVRAVHDIPLSEIIRPLLGKVLDFLFPGIGRGRYRQAGRKKHAWLDRPYAQLKNRFREKAIFQATSLTVPKI